MAHSTPSIKIPPTIIKQIHEKHLSNPEFNDTFEKASDKIKEFITDQLDPNADVELLQTNLIVYKDIYAKQYEEAYGPYAVSRRPYAVSRRPYAVSRRPIRILTVKNKPRETMTLGGKISKKYKSKNRKFKKYYKKSRKSRKKRFPHKKSRKKTR